MNGLYESDSDNTTVRIMGMEIPVIEYSGERVITFGMIDRLHQRPKGTAGRNFRRNRLRFEEGKHYFKAGRDEFSLARWTYFGFNKFVSKMFLMTESGYLNIIQSFRLHTGIVRKVLRRYFGNLSSPSVVVVKSYESEFGKILKDSLKGIALVREQVVISDYKADFLLPEYGIIVEYDEEHHKSLANSRKDKIRDDILASLGYVVIRVSKTEPIGEGLNKILSVIWKMKKCSEKGKQALKETGNQN